MPKKINNVKLNNLIIAMFIIAMQNCFFFINTNKINIAGKFAYSDIWLIIYIIFFGLMSIKYCFKGEKKYYFGGIVFLLAFLVFVSAYQQKKYTGQSLGLGIRPQRIYLFILLSYFPITQLFRRKKIDIDSLVQIIYFCGLISAVIFIIQKLLINNFQFLYFMISSRNGSARFYIDSSLIQLSTLIATYYFCTRKNRKYIVSLGILVFYQFWVTQGRLEIMSLLISITLGIALTGKLTKRKVILVFFTIIIIVFFSTTTYVDNLIEAIKMSSTASAAEGNTMAIRNTGRELYRKQLLENFNTLFLGCGYPNILYGEAREKAGLNENINLNDNGMYGFTYIFGLSGVIVISVLVYKFFKTAIYIYKKTGNTIPILYICMNVCLAYNIIFWYWNADGNFLLILMLCYVQQLKKELDEGVKENG